MQLRVLPDGSRTPLIGRRAYSIERAEAVGDEFVVLGCITVDGREHDWFVGVYDEDGERVDGSGCITTASHERAAEYFAAWVRRRSN